MSAPFVCVCKVLTEREDAEEEWEEVSVVCLEVVEWMGEDGEGRE